MLVTLKNQQNTIKLRNALGNYFALTGGYSTLTYGVQQATTIITVALEWDIYITLR